MITLDMISYDLLESIRASRIVDAERIDFRNLEYWIINQRNIWIKRKLDKIKDIDDNIVQTITSTLSTIDSSNNTTYPSYTKIRRTTLKIPPLIELNYGNALFEITSEDILSKNICYVPFDRLRWCGNSKFNKNLLFAAIRDGYVWIKGGDDFTLQSIIIRGVFQNPLDVPGFDSDTMAFPINLDIINYMKEMIIKSDLQAILSTKSDEINDSSGKIDNNTKD